MMKNTYNVKDDKVYINLTQGQITMIDLSDLERVSQQYDGTWIAHYDKKNKSYYVHGYKVINNKTKCLVLPRIIMNIDDPKIKVDHINHDTLNNTKENLRICTHQENMRNQKRRTNATSIYKGVSWYKKYTKWVCNIKHNYKTIYLGYFDDEIEAARAYDVKARELFGEFALTNFPYIP